MAKAAVRRPSRVLRAAAGRVRLLAAMAVAAAVGLALHFGLKAPPSISAVVGWDVGCLAFFALVLPPMRGGTPARMRQRAAHDDEGRGVILVLVVLASIVSVAAVAGELQQAHARSGLARDLHVALAFATVAASWFLAHLNFALHYAHAYYDPGGRGGTQDARGLKFPGAEPPDYWDFLHFSLIIGVACQTADVAIASKALRRVSTFHSLFAFAFNTVIVALTINLLAGLFE